MMIKKRAITSLNSISDELKEMLKLEYPTGYEDSMVRIEKPQGGFFYAVPLETEEISYLIKINVKIDDKPLEDDDDKNYFDEEIKNAEEIADPDKDDMDDDEM